MLATAEHLLHPRHWTRSPGSLIFLCWLFTVVCFHKTGSYRMEVVSHHAHDRNPFNENEC